MSNNGGAMCGGVISESQDRKDEKKYGMWCNMMCYVMPDKYYEKYLTLRKAGKENEAHKIFEKHSWSKI